VTSEALAPQKLRSWEGIRDPNVGPSDSTGAVGTSRYVELVNSKFAIYNRTNNDPLVQGTLNELAGESSSAFVFDPQVIWDPTTERFYYVMDDIISATDTRLAFGFSKDSTPESGGDADWCKYTIPFGTRFPDYPKLGDTQNRLLIGVNSFDSVTDAYLGSDLIALPKPPSGTTCPATLTPDVQPNLKNEDGTGAFTPRPGQPDRFEHHGLYRRPGGRPAR
jgi:hypothetical protein